MKNNSSIGETRKMKEIQPNLKWKSKIQKVWEKYSRSLLNIEESVNYISLFQFYKKVWILLLERVNKEKITFNI